MKIINAVVKAYGGRNGKINLITSSSGLLKKGGIMKKAFFIIAVLTVMLTSCAPKIKEGEIYAKNYHPAHTAIVTITVVNSCGKVTTTSLIPVLFYYPEAWEISYRAFNEKSHKWDSATVWVSHETYDMAKIGAWYERTDADLDDQPRVRQKNKE